MRQKRKNKLLLTVFVIIQPFHTNKKMKLYIKKMTVDPKPVFLGLSKLFGSSEEKSSVVLLSNTVALNP